MAPEVRRHHVNRLGFDAFVAETSLRDDAPAWAWHTLSTQDPVESFQGLTSNFDSLNRTLIPISDAETRSHGQRVTDITYKAAAAYARCALDVQRLNGQGSLCRCTLTHLQVSLPPWLPCAKVIPGFMRW